MVETLSRLALNCATLARQVLLQRTGRSVPETVEHLIGLQVRTPHSWYIRLWTRVAGFFAEQVMDLLTDRTLVRILFEPRMR